MYIKVQTRTRVGKDGKKSSCFYPRLYESYRDSDGKTRQHYLLPLELDDLPSWKDRYAMCHILNDMVANGPELELDDTPVTRKAKSVYGQLAAKGLLGDVARVEEMNRREQASAWIVSTTQYQLCQKGSRISWREVIRIAGTQHVVSTVAKRMDGQQVEVRQCTEPEAPLLELYGKLGMESLPLKRKRKICVVHFSKVKKNDT